MLKLKNVSKYYYQDGVIAEGFSKVNLELHLGEFVVITGESGSGKSTLLNVLSGLDTYEDGEMYINGEETSHYTEEDFLEYRRKYVSNIFQNFNLVNSYTVYENIELALLLNGKNRREVKKYVLELIDKVGLKKYRHTKTSKLSGGQKQRVAIARALANDTPIIVADEPTGALDSKSASEIIKLLADISKEKLVIIVTHNKKEIEEYATRLIRMHDGKLLENKVIKNINLDDSLKAKEINNITLASKIRLAVRNTFNIPIKYILMFIIFMLISVTLITHYAGFKRAENEESNTSYNSFFNNSSDKRIILTKKDKSLFNEDDYNKIKNIKNIDYVVENDLLNEASIYIENNSNIYISGSIYVEDDIKADLGRMPVNKNEIVLIGSKDNYYISKLSKDILNKTFNTEYGKLTVVGISYNNSSSDEYNFEFYLNKELLSDVRSYMFSIYSSREVIINKSVFNDEHNNTFIILYSENVNSGDVYIKDTMSMYCKNYNCSKEKLTIKVSNMYYEESINLNIKEINKNNAKKLFDIKYEDGFYDVLYVSKEDYKKLFDKGNYQCSVFAKEIKDLDTINKEINNLGYNTLKLRDSKLDEAAEVLQIFRIFKLVVTIILIITLFFIAYFIIKIIYKSRNSYYTTLRTLGSTKKVCVDILRKELVNHATITYLLFLLLMYLINTNKIKLDYLKDLAIYVTTRDYIIVYLILVGLSILMSIRYGRKIFKDSIIKTYGERI
jgi:ABC-type lipoprotein export system ATPase subunit